MNYWFFAVVLIGFVPIFVFRNLVKRQLLQYNRERKVDRGNGAQKSRIPSWAKLTDTVSSSFII